MAGLAIAEISSCFLFWPVCRVDGLLISDVVGALIDISGDYEPDLNKRLMLPDR
jgi:hypothetical protein